MSPKVLPKETDQEQGPHGVVHEHDCCCEEHEPA